jgi:lipopolysaccharide transport system permease protein
MDVDMQATGESAYEVQIKPNANWLDFPVRELFEFRDVLLLLVQRDFLLKYKQTILGPLWFLLQPLLTTLVFTVIFNRVAQLPTDGLPPILFYLSGLTIWSYLSLNVTSTSNIFGNYAYLFEKVYFPRLIAPLASTFSNAIAMLVQFISLVGFVFFFKLTGAKFFPKYGEAIYIIPLLMLQTAFLSLGVGLLCSACTAKYRDLTHLIAFLLQIWMYVTPIVYPASRISQQYHWIILANPAAPIIENFRGVVLGVSTITARENIISIAITGLLLIAGLLIFRRTERTFVDSI